MLEVSLDQRGEWCVYDNLVGWNRQEELPLELPLTFPRLSPISSRQPLFGEATE
jgi:hypothetical protein